MSLRFGLVIVASAALSIHVGVGVASALSAFHTPAWVAQCYVVGEEAQPALSYVRLSDGFFVSMDLGGPARTGFRPRDRGVHDIFAARRLLGFGRYWSFGRDYGCASRSAGLTCWNRVGHGWRLGRNGRYRIF